MGKDSLVDLEDHGTGCYTIWLNRPDKHNAFNRRFIQEIIDICSVLERTTDVRVVLLRGRGRSFSAGADIEYMQHLGRVSEQENSAEAKHMAKAFEGLNGLPFPVIGIVDGAALGGGAGLVAVCDHVIAGPRARFGFTEVRVGLVPAVISPYVVAKIGYSWARTLFLSGRKIDAQEACTIGLVHQVAATEEALEEAGRELIAEFLQCSPDAIARTKTLLGCLPALSPGAAVTEYTTSVIAEARVALDGQEGLAAFLEKRPAAWIPGRGE